MTALDTASATVRAFLTGDFSTYRQLHGELGKDERGAFSVVLAAAFRDAATRRFGERYDLSEVIGFVAEARSEYPHVAEQVTAEDGERAVRIALGEDDLLGTMDGRRYGAAQAAMLFALTHETDASRAGIHPLVTAATEQAEGYLRRRERRAGALWLRTLTWRCCGLHYRAMTGPLTC